MENISNKKKIKNPSKRKNKRDLNNTLNLHRDEENTKNYFKVLEENNSDDSTNLHIIPSTTGTIKDPISFTIPINNNKKRNTEKVWTSSDVQKITEDEKITELKHRKNIDKLPFEDRIALLNASSEIKEKAFIKLKEIKGKTEDNSSKAIIYLEGLLRIPFGVFKYEPILTCVKDINKQFLLLTITIQYNPENFFLFRSSSSLQRSNVSTINFEEINDFSELSVKKNKLEMYPNVSNLSSQATANRYSPTLRSGEFLNTEIHNFDNFSEGAAEAKHENFETNCIKLIKSPERSVEKIFGIQNKNKYTKVEIIQNIKIIEKNIDDFFEKKILTDLTEASLKQRVDTSHSVCRTVINEKFSEDKSKGFTNLDKTQPTLKLETSSNVHRTGEDVDFSDVECIKNKSINGVSVEAKNEFIETKCKENEKISLILKFIELLYNFINKFDEGASEAKNEFIEQKCNKIENFIKVINEIYKKITRVKSIKSKIRFIKDFILYFINFSIEEHLLCSEKNTEKIKECKYKIFDFFENHLYGSYEDCDLFVKNLENQLFKNPEGSIIEIYKKIKEINKMSKEIENHIQCIKQTLDESIYGHEHAKNQILKLICQWMTGEHTGYCFGFEGSPGIGKTSLAKNGLSKCLKDIDGVYRPFSFITLGGSSNGSTLEGHNYTYTNSTWGKIVDVLMDSKCMNPIIYIDELDKVSKTEQGKEIIGILTHIIDFTQNDSFQDRYFNGINIDLSKVLFIFSYNDPELIDHILLDRIHRIKFDNLTVEDKVVIVEKHLLPEINSKMGFENTINLEKEVIVEIIENYTCEPGVRKLKEILFDLYGGINMDILTYLEEELLKPKINLPSQATATSENSPFSSILQMSEDVSKWRFPDIIFNKFPFNISIENFEMIRMKYLKKYNKIKHTVVHTESKSGIVNGLWANNLGNGGIVPIECVFYPSSIFLELQLTGMQGNVMKESMNIAKNLAWKLTPQKRQKELLNYFKNTKCQGLHIHCPDGAIAKDGPSAGAAITISIYSLFNNVKINNNIAVTGEINLQGNITEVGGIDAKVFGGIKAGVTIFFYPFENEENIRNVKKKIMNCSNIIDKSKNMYSHTTAKWHSLERSVGECINTPNKVVSVKGYTFISLKNINDIFETPLKDYNIFES